MAGPLLRQGAGKTEQAMFLLCCLLFFLIPCTTSPAVIAGGLLLLLWLLSGRFYTGREGYMGEGWALPVVLLFLLPFLGLAHTPYPELGIKMAQKSYYWLLTFAIATIMTGERGRRVFAYCFLAGTSFSVVISFLQHMGLVPLHRAATATGFINHINYGLLLVMAITILTFMFRQEASAPRKRALAALMLAFTVNLAMSPSRAGLLSFLALSPLMLMNLFGRRNVILIAAASAVLGASLFLSPVVRQRVSLAVDEMRDFDRQGRVETSIGLRLVMWEGALKIFRDNPVIGIGTGGYAMGMEKYRRDTGTDDITHPHNSFLYMAATYGTVGLLILLWYLWVLFRKGWRNREDLGGVMVLSFSLVFIVGSLTDTQLLTYATGAMAALMTGIRVD